MDILNQTLFVGFIKQIFAIYIKNDNDIPDET